MRKPHVLVVSWWFPPLSGGGVYRPLNFARGLVERGYRVTVLTAKPSAVHAQDPSLLAQIPASVRVLRCPHFDPFRLYAALKKLIGRDEPGAAPQGTNGSGHARELASWKDLWSERCALPDKWRSWVFPATMRAAVGLAGDEPDVVFSTSPPHSQQLVSMKLKTIFGAALVLDFRDPWIGNPFRHFSVASLNALDQELERLAVGAADRVICNTPLLEQRMRSRYPEFDHFRTITNGFAPELANLALAPPEYGDEPVEFLHVGHLYGARSGRYLLRGLEQLKNMEPDQCSGIRVRLVGQIECRDDYLKEAERRGVREMLSTSGSIPHHESLQLQREAKALLILGVEEKGREVQVPGKLYEYFAMQRPILTLSRRGGAIQQVIDLARVPYEIAEPDNPEDIAAAMLRFVARAKRGELAKFDRKAIDQFRYDALCERFEQCLLGALKPAPSPSTS